MRRTIRIAAVVLVLGAGWCVWAALAVLDLANAVDRDDAVGLARRIDWVAVRQGLREDLTARLAAATADGSAALGSAAIDRAVNVLSTERAIASLIRAARFRDRGWDGALPPTANAPAGRREEFKFYRIDYAFFAGGPFSLRVDIRPDSDGVKEPLILVFNWSGDWRLARVILPADAFGGAAAATPAAPAAPEQKPPQISSAPATPAPIVAATPSGPKALLFEEDSNDPRGKAYVGSVIWRTEQVASAGRPAELEVRASVDLPDRPLKLTLLIRRNTDKALTASHTIDIKIDVPADSTTKGVEGVPGVIMKPDEAAPGTPLTGATVRLSDTIYSIGLSSTKAAMEKNIEALKNQAWFAVPILYKNKKRAVVAIEKGESGTSSIAEALARWDAEKTPDKPPDKVTAKRGKKK